MSALVTVRRSRKDRLCREEPWAHDPRIRPGDLYARVAVTPDDNDLGNVGWWTMVLCEECAGNRGYMPRKAGFVPAELYALLSNLEGEASNG